MALQATRNGDQYVVSYTIDIYIYIYIIHIYKCGYTIDTIEMWIYTSLYIYIYTFLYEFWYMYLHMYVCISYSVDIYGSMMFL